MVLACRDRLRGDEVRPRAKRLAVAPNDGPSSVSHSTLRGRGLAPRRWASVRGEGPGGEDEDLLVRLRALVGEACDHHADGDSPAAMARLRVAQDLVDLRIVALAEG